MKSPECQVYVTDNATLFIPNSTDWIRSI